MLRRSLTMLAGSSSPSERATLAAFSSSVLNRGDADGIAIAAEMKLRIMMEARILTDSRCSKSVEDLRSDELFC